MPLAISPELEFHLAQDVTTLSTLVLVERLDGVKLGFTDCDQSIHYEGEDYLPAGGISLSSISQSVGSESDDSEVAGFIEDDRISEDDLAAGLYSGATVVVMLVNRRSLSDGHIHLATYTIGKVTLEHSGFGDSRGGVFKAEALGLSSQLRQVVGEKTSATCRCRRLGDAACKLNLAGNAANGFAITASRTVSVVTDALNVRFVDTAPSHHYKDGLVTFTSGANDGLTREIKAHSLVSGSAHVELRTPFPFAIEVGDSVSVEAGCDRTITRCRGYFSNANNFHGEPELPGNDTVLKQGRGS